MSKIWIWIQAQASTTSVASIVLQRHRSSQSQRRRRCGKMSCSSSCGCGEIESGYWVWDRHLVELHARRCSSTLMSKIWIWIQVQASTTSDTLIVSYVIVPLGLNDWQRRDCKCDVNYIVLRRWCQRYGYGYKFKLQQRRSRWLFYNVIVPPSLNDVNDVVDKLQQ